MKHVISKGINASIGQSTGTLFLMKTKLLKSVKKDISAYMKGLVMCEFPLYYTYNLLSPVSLIYFIILKNVNKNIYYQYCRSDIAR